jgi:hypothetical protein
MKLTEAEFQALKACLNYDDRESQLEDNFSNGGPTEFAQVLGWDLHQVGGLIASLTSKGLGGLDDRSEEMMTDENGRLYPKNKVPAELHIFWLSDEGVHAVFDEIEARSMAA